MRVCSVHGCPELYPTSEGSKCRAHRAQADHARGTARERGYTTKGHQTFRNAVLTRDPICVTPNCTAWATVADHHPRTRRELLNLGLNPNDPNYGRGLCVTHHNQHTAATTPGGWANQ